MEITEIQNLYSYLKYSRIIGMGTSAICFLMPNGKVLKVYYERAFKRYIAANMDMFSDIGNDSFIAPSELLFKNGLCLAQIYKYIPGKTFNNINSNYTIKDILIGYKKLIEDTRKISEKSFVLCDIHDRNILFNGEFKIIDLDRGYIDRSYSCDAILISNMKKINEVILHSLFNVSLNKIIEFENFDIQNIYNKTFVDIEKFPLLLEMIDEHSNTNIKKLSKKIKFKTTINSYYKL